MHFRTLVLLLYNSILIWAFYIQIFTNAGYLTNWNNKQAVQSHPNLSLIFLELPKSWLAWRSPLFTKPCLDTARHPVNFHWNLFAVVHFPLIEPTSFSFRVSTFFPFVTAAHFRIRQKIWRASEKAIKGTGCARLCTPLFFAAAANNSHTVSRARRRTHTNDAP